MFCFLNKELITDDIEKDISRLFAQLSRRFQQKISDVLSTNNPPFVVCYMENNRVYGMASLITYKAISGYKGWIEDVVVDSQKRGLKIGEKLIDLLIEKAEEIGLAEILLFTSNEKNKIAVNLYKKKNFHEKGTEVFVKKLKKIYPDE